MRLLARLAAALVLLAAWPARAAWQEASSDHFIVYGDMPEREIEENAETLERFDRAIRQLLHLNDNPAGRANRVTVYVVPGVGAVQKLCNHCPQGVAGFYRPQAGGSFAVMPRRNGEGRFDLQATQVMQHEYAHALMFENYNQAYPAWYTEGFAEFVATAHVEKDGAYAFGETPLYRAWGLVRGTPMRLATLLDPPSRMRPEEHAIFYARSWLLTHYLTSDPVRSKQFEDYIARFNRGEPSVAAARAAFGDLDQLDRALDAYLRGKLSYWRMPAGRITPGRVEVRALRPGEAAFMPVRLRSVAGVDRKQAVALVAPARQAAAPYPDDPWVQGALAEVEYDAGNDDAAEAAADRALAADPKALNALLYKGRVQVRRAVQAKATDPAMWRRARSWFVRANRDDPQRALPLKLFYDSFVAAGMTPTDNAVAGLRQAFQLAPQDRRLRATVALQAIRDGRIDEARTLLRALAYDPHAEPPNPAATLLAALDGPDGLNAARAMTAALQDKAQDQGSP